MSAISPADLAALSPIIMIPARMASERLPGKPLADILGKPMIVRVWERAQAAGVGPVVVACAEQDIKQAVEAEGGIAVLTRPDHPSGSDRIFEALSQIDPDHRHRTVINVQGDLPTIDPALILAALKPLVSGAYDMATLVAEIVRAEEKSDPNVVKAVAGFDPDDPDPWPIARALYFSRVAVPANAGPLYHHIGLYAYRREALENFVAWPPGILEKREKLEQLRALEHGLSIAAVRVDTVPLGVDTAADLNRARDILAGL
ncbi:MAG: 3-deoxy-manno-octulosonate cytidylyltransferase [Rhodospirillaceae bacterium]|nr:3-deoxy-manno-octulosonate cytidylyltransferase [Rhodospirillaceae bacterium]